MGKDEADLVCAFENYICGADFIEIWSSDGLGAGLKLVVFPTKLRISVRLSCSLDRKENESPGEG